MTISNRLVRLIKSVSELGLTKSAYFGIYLLAKKSGFYLRQRSPSSFPAESYQDEKWIFSFFQEKETLLQGLSSDEIEQIAAAADYVVNGQMLAFGMIPQQITFDNQKEAKHWSKISDAYTDGDDIKLHWETARFSWIFPLMQAYHLTGSQKYYDTFKKYAIEFFERNPYLQGIQWLSAQEVAFRMIAMITAYCIFNESLQNDPAFRLQLLEQIWQHANRIPSTIIYARAQNNNHLLSDALGMLFAGAFFHSLPAGKKWMDKGWQLFNETIQSQIQPNGTYVQQSMNYHRLMLTECVWAKKIADVQSLSFPSKSVHAIQNAVQWLGQFIQEENGLAPNLGHNDGSLIFPLSNPDYGDYKTIHQSCMDAFLSGKTENKSEITRWLNVAPISDATLTKTPALPLIRYEKFFIYLRAETYTDRPAHADQNHMDIWSNGECIAMDAGTYRYTGMEPWNNSLAHTINHNTLTIEDADQMTWAGRFRWLDWSSGKYLLEESEFKQITAIHDGYIRSGILHKRNAKLIGDTTIEVTDQLIPQNAKTKVKLCRLHWLLPDGTFSIDQNHVELLTEKNNFMLSVNVMQNNMFVQKDFAIIRCGYILHGNPAGQFPTLGWYSPTYQVKLPAISFLTTIMNPELPLIITSHWKIK